MATSGLACSIQRRDGSKPAKIGAHGASALLPVSSATPSAGTWEVLTPAMIRAIRPLRLAAIAFDLPPAFPHHLRVRLGGGAGHERRELLHRQPVAERELDREEDVAAEVDHAIPVPREHRVALFRRHRMPRDV